LRANIFIVVLLAGCSALPVLRVSLMLIGCAADKQCQARSIEDGKRSGRVIQGMILSPSCSVLLTAERLGSGGIRSKAGSTAIGEEHMGS